MYWLIHQHNNILVYCPCIITTSVPLPVASHISATLLPSATVMGLLLLGLVITGCSDQAE